MSIMPNPYDPALLPSTDPNASSAQIMPKPPPLDAHSPAPASVCSSLCSSFAKCLHARTIVQNLYMQVLITLLTVVSLFMEDIRIIFIGTDSDIAVDVVNIVFIVLFMLEIMFSLSVPGYACSFFFYLDIISTLSIIMDVSMLTNLLYSTSQMSSGLQLSTIIKHSKASRAAARTVRVMKIFRLARIVKLYKSAVKAKQLKSKKNKQLMNQRLRSMRLKKIKKAQQNKQLGSYRNVDIQSHLQSRNQNENGNGNENENRKDNGNANENEGVSGQGMIFSSILARDCLSSKHNLSRKIMRQNIVEYNLQGEIMGVGMGIDRIITNHQEVDEIKIDELDYHQEHQDGHGGWRGTAHKDEAEKMSSHNSSPSDNNPEQDQVEITSQMTRTQSKISKLLSQNSMKKIILVILLLMFSVPVLDIDNYYQQTSAWDFLANFLQRTLPNPSIPIQKLNQLINNNIQGSRNSDQDTQELIYFSTPFKQLYQYDADMLGSLRLGDLTISQVQVNITQVLIARNYTLTIQEKFHEDGRDTITIILNCRQFNQIDSWFSIAKILFICAIIIYLLNTFNQTISQLITEPIQRMLDDVKSNGKYDTFQFMNVATRTQDISQKKITQSNNYETTHVHQALTKISNLLSKIFSCRGKEIIYKKIFQEGNVITNYLSQNKRVYCIVGLCSIQNYFAISEILKSDVIGLHNQIAEYLHSATFRYGGRAVMNYQGSFLIVFQCPSQYEHLIKEERSQKKKSSKSSSKSPKSHERNLRSFNYLNKLQKPRRKMISCNAYNNIGNGKEKLLNSDENKQNNYLNIFTDFSIFAMVKTLVKINKEANFYKYRKDARLAHSLGQNYQVKINCMLHSGWVQEGFLGSSVKMDFCYFGKTINDLKKMAYFCHKLPNSLILSENVYNLSTFGMKRYSRILSNYVDPEKQTQKMLYSIDLNLQNISPPKTIKKQKNDFNSLILKKQLNFEFLKDTQEIKKYKAESFINAKKQLRQVMRNVVSQQFKRKYTLAYDHYVCGEYAESKQILDDLISFSKDDLLVLRLNHLILSASKNTNNKYNSNIPIYDEEIQWLSW